MEVVKHEERPLRNKLATYIKFDRLKPQQTFEANVRHDLRSRDQSIELRVYTLLKRFCPFVKIIGRFSAGDRLKFRLGRICEADLMKRIRSDARYGSYAPQRPQNDSTI